MILLSTQQEERPTCHKQQKDGHLSDLVWSHFRVLDLSCQTAKRSVLKMQGAHYDHQGPEFRV